MSLFQTRRHVTGNSLPRPPVVPPYLWVPAVGITGLGLYTYYAFLDEVPLTKRKRWIATTPQFEEHIGDQQYQQLLQQYKGKILPESHRASVTVKRVGGRIAKASEKFVADERLKFASKSPYSYTVVRSDEANAFVLPNNHVFVLTGLFNYVKDEDELAAVLGHEVAHNLARHVGERLSGGVLVQIIGGFLLLLDPSGVLTYFFLPVVNILRELPHSREHESEADRIGIHLAATACHDPRAAKRVFEAMGKGISGAPPEFLSTHPSHSTRIVQFDEWLPSAIQEYEGEYGNRCSSVRSDMQAARRLVAEDFSQRERRK
jgi:metalloendopeptidase OMA1, mitochondrial